MRTRNEVLEYGLSLPDTYRDTPFRDQNWVLVRVCINVKVDPEWRDFWRNAYNSVLPGYHQNKDHWNTIILDGTVPADEIKRMIAECYDLVI